VHGFLRTAYWSPNVPREVVERSLEHSLNFGLYEEPAERGGGQIGFARVVTDFAAFAYLADVFVVEQRRGRGLGVWLVETVLDHPGLRGLRRIALGTRDAHSLYERFGFEPADPQVLMTLERSAEDLYGRPPGG
jgi:GNAT superfamily N-acetyltransferase